jgi:hypothetical protein
MPKKRDDILNQANAEVLVNLAIDPTTPEPLRVKIITHIIEAKRGQDFFKTIFEENLSFGECPCCKHENHWAIPEDELNKMGYVTHLKDLKVSINTTAETCPEFQEACKKKKINV